MLEHGLLRLVSIALQDRFHNRFVCIEHRAAIGSAGSRNLPATVQESRQCAVQLDDLFFTVLLLRHADPPRCFSSPRASTANLPLIPTDTENGFWVTGWLKLMPTQ